MVSFCQPEGCLTVGPKRLAGLKETTSFVFTLTRDEFLDLFFEDLSDFFLRFCLAGDESAEEDDESESDDDEDEEEELLLLLLLAAALAACALGLGLALRCARSSSVR